MTRIARPSSVVLDVPPGTFVLDAEPQPAEQAPAPFPQRATHVTPIDAGSRLP